MNRLGEEKRRRIATLLAEGYSIRTVATFVGCHRDTVMRIAHEQRLSRPRSVAMETHHAQRRAAEAIAAMDRAADRARPELLAIFFDVLGAQP